MIYGTRISLVVGLSAVAFAMVVGIAFGLVAGYVGGAADALLMRVADVQLTFPAILIALLVSGIVSVALPSGLHERLEVYVLIFAIGISRWPQFARTVRGSTMVERGRDYVLAARVIGLSGPRIVLTHILPNAFGPVVVIATINIGLSILDEATLSFLGVGLPATQPSLGTLIRVGNDFLYSGEWWITIFPGVLLAVMVLAINLLGDWLRDALNPRLR
jgi:peptide/nickel transport system permease protein